MTSIEADVDQDGNALDGWAVGKREYTEQAWTPRTDPAKDANGTGCGFVLAIAVVRTQRRTFNGRADEARIVFDSAERRANVPTLTLKQ